MKSQRSFYPFKLQPQPWCFTLLLLSFLLLPALAGAQVQLGGDVDGEAVNDESGSSVSLSADGARLAIGAPDNDGNGTSSGHVRVYEWAGSAWAQVGMDIDGEAVGDNSGRSVSLSADGARLAIGAPGNDGNGTGSGHVRVYEWTGSTWAQVGMDIDGEAVDDNSASVSLSADGVRLAIGAPGNEDNGNDSGHVRVYEWTGSAWVQVGMDIDGEAAFDYSGSSVSLSADGVRLAIGAPGNDDNGNDSGHVRVYEWTGSAWVQVGMDIDGEAAFDYSGSSVSLSADGVRLAIGAYGNDDNGNDSGHVRVYEWTGSAWAQVGMDIDGEAADNYSGSSVSLSADGVRLAIGAPGNEDNGNDSGHVRVYEWTGSAWVQVGMDIDGEAAFDYSGASVSLSADGVRLAIGAYGNDSGQVRVFDITQKYGGGQGTVANPYLIATTAHLIELSNSSGDWGSHFLQTADLAFDAMHINVDWDGDGTVGDADDAAGFLPIGISGTNFAGSYDGDGKTISNLFIDRSTIKLGLFRQLEGTGSVSGLGLLNVYISGAGGDNSQSYSGALVGENRGGSIDRCYSTGYVEGPNSVGGLVGLNNGTITNSYSSCDVVDTPGGIYNGAAGLAAGNNGFITNCYSVGHVTGEANLGGLVINSNSNVTNSFWDTDTSGQSTSAGGEGKSTAEMKDIFTFSGAEWGGPWYIDFAQSENSGYPNLASIGVPVVAGSRSIEIVSTGGGSEDTDWGMANGIMYSLQDSPTSVNVSDVVSKLGLSPLEIVGSSLDVNGMVTSGSSNILYLNLETGGTIQPGAALDLGGGLYLVGDTRLTLTSSSTSYSSLIVDGPLTENCGGGCISYERYTNQVGTGSTGGNDLVGTPFTGQTFGPFAAANTNLAASGGLRAFGPWDNAGTGFINYDVTANASTTLTPGTGYRAATTDGSPVTFTGTVQTGNVTVNITDAASQWNAVANPYPAYLSMADFLNYDHGGGVTNQSLMAETAAGIYGYDGNSTDGWTVITLANASTSLMAPGQGFFVAADAADIDAYDLTFTPTMMRTGDSDDFINGFAPVNTPVYFKLQAFTDSRSYGTSIYFNEASATGLDVGYDAVLWGDAIPDFSVYTHLVSEDEGEPFALQSLGLSDLDDPELAIPLGLEAAAGIPLTLAITEEELPAGIEVYLLDSLNGERTLLSGLPYTFTPNAALSGAGRYYLVFNAGQVVSTSSETDGGDLSALVIYAPQYRDELVITGELPGAAQLSLYDVQGRKLLGRALSVGTTQQTVATGHLPGGIYLVRIESPQGVRAEQLFIP